MIQRIMISRITTSPAPTVIGRRAPVAAATISPTSRTKLPQASANRRAASVGGYGFRVRSSSCRPRVFSNSAIWRLSNVCTFGSPCATRVMLPARTTFSSDSNRSSETPFYENKSVMTSQSCDIRFPRWQESKF